MLIWQIAKSISEDGFLEVKHPWLPSYMTVYSFMASHAPPAPPIGNRSMICTFAQALTNTCDIEQQDLPKPSVKGDVLCINISQEEYEKG